MNLLKKYFRTSVIAVILAFTSLFAILLPMVTVNAVSAQIEIISIEETIGRSVEITFNSRIMKKQISYFTITASPDFSGITQPGNSSLQQNKQISKKLNRKATGLIIYEFKPIPTAVPYTFKVCAKSITGKTICSDSLKHPQHADLLDQISRLSSDWGNLKPIQLLTPAPTTAPVALPAFTLSSATESRTVNTAATGFTITSTGGAIASFAISATPAGMSFSTTTGALTGTPTSVAGATAYTITATNATGSATQTFTLTVTVGAALKVAVTRASVGTSPGIAFTTQPQITIQDSGGNTITSSTAVVTATVSAGGALVGTATATASSGIATFSNLGIRGFGGTAYTITYTAAGLTTDTQSVTPSALIVGNTGPGGGKIFYVAASSGFTCGATLNETCYYLEAAPTSGTSAWADIQRTWSTGANQRVSVPNANETSIGTGYKNSLAIVAQTGNEAGSSAAVAARGYGGPNSLSDWFLPSKAELNQLYTERISVGGFVDDFYWSSSERDAITAWGQYFTNGNQDFGWKDSAFYVRPVRAF